MSSLDSSVWGLPKDAIHNTMEWSLTNTAASGQTVWLTPWSLASILGPQSLTRVLGNRIRRPTSWHVSTKYLADYQQTTYRAFVLILVVQSHRWTLISSITYVLYLPRCWGIFSNCCLNKFQFNLNSMHQNVPPLQDHNKVCGRVMTTFPEFSTIYTMLWLGTEDICRVSCRETSGGGVHSCKHALSFY